ncbi:MAG: matrixin family metalloprotease [Phycisphaerae bacterium]
MMRTKNLHGVWYGVWGVSLVLGFCIHGCGNGPLGDDNVGGGSIGSAGRGRESERRVRFDDLPDGGSRGPLADFSVRTRWQKQNITYYIVNETTDMDPQVVRDVFTEAFATWADVVPLTFTEVDRPDQADMVMGFGSGDHCELYDASGNFCSDAAFDGPSGTLAHCYFPPGSGGPNAGDCHFDEAELWTGDNDPSGSETRLLETAIHELGHGLGLAHSEDPEAIMFPNYDPFSPSLQLMPDDIAGIQSLYGSGDGNVDPRQGDRPEQPREDDIPGVGGQPVEGDSDGDGIDDATEIYMVGTDPYAFDTDGDGLSDFEVVFWLNPLNPDSDGDGMSDGEEVANGTDPLTPDLGGGAVGLEGVYVGRDAAGSGLVFEVGRDGSLVGLLSVMQWGEPLDWELYGGVGPDGDVLMISWDSFFVLEGVIQNGVASGDLYTMSGYVGRWDASVEGATGGNGGGCDDSCPFAFDGECDDGRPGAVTNACPSGTDCNDCEGGGVPVGGEGDDCNDSCPFAFDGECDDGRPGAVTNACPSGTDCNDCAGGANNALFKSADGVRVEKSQGVDQRRVLRKRITLLKESSRRKGILGVKRRGSMDVYQPVPAHRGHVHHPVLENVMVGHDHHHHHDH